MNYAVARGKHEANTGNGYLQLNNPTHCTDIFLSRALSKSRESLKDKLSSPKVSGVRRTVT
jgi:hypothetical protein